MAAVAAAMNDPSSMASKWRTVNTEITKANFLVDGPALHSLQALYPAGALPESMTTWDYDFGALLYVDLKTWSDQATSWSDGEITSAQLAPFSDSVNRDVASLQADVRDIQAGK